MTIETKKVFALAAAIAVSGVLAVELTRSQAQADPQTGTMSYIEAYSAARVDTAFDLVAMLPRMPTVMIPIAQKGDLEIPLGCGTVGGDTQAECMDVAYEVDSEPSLVVETRFAGGSTLVRMDAMTVAGVTDAALQSE